MPRRLVSPPAWSIASWRGSTNEAATQFLVRTRVRSARDTAGLPVGGPCVDGARPAARGGVAGGWSSASSRHPSHRRWNSEAPSAAPSAAPAVGLTPAPGTIASDGSTEVGSLPYGDALIGLADRPGPLRGHRPASAIRRWSRNPKTGAWKATGEMVGNRGGPTTVLLPDGRVLLLGGDSAAPDATSASGPAPATADLRSEDGQVCRGRANAGERLELPGHTPGRWARVGGRRHGVRGRRRDPAGVAEIFDPKTATFATGGWHGAAERELDDPVARRSGVGHGMGGGQASDARHPQSGATEARAYLLGRAVRPCDGSVHARRRDDRSFAAPRRGTLVAAGVAGRRLVAGWSRPLCRPALPRGEHDRRRQRERGIRRDPGVIYDPRSATFSLGTPLPHCVGQAMGLPDGRVFVTGWYEAAGPGDSTRCASSGMTDASEVCWSGIYDPTTGTTTMGKEPPAGPYLDLLQVPDGRVYLIWPGGPTLFH